MNNTYLKAGIYMVDLGAIPGEVKGHEQANKRPCLIIQPINNLQLAVIIPFTTKSKSYLYSVVEVEKGIGNLTSKSYALCHHIRSISYERIEKHIGTLPQNEFFQVLTVLADFLEIPTN